MRRRILAFAALVASLGASPVRAQDDAPTADVAYVHAVEAMRTLVSPPYATYESSWESTGLGFDFEQDRDRIVIVVGFGGELLHERRYDAAYRSADRTLQFTNVAGDRLVGKGHLLEPTWAAAYDILRYGLKVEDAAAVTTSTPSPLAAESTPVPDVAASPTREVSGAPLHDIGSVTAISPLYYRVSDEGTRPCPGLGDGRALHLVARHGIQQHPLTDVVLDPSTGRFCSMTFVLKDSGIAGVTGHYTLDFAPFGTYWLVCDGSIDINVRLFGISAKHATLHWVVSNVTTPSALPDATFVPPTPEPTRAPHGKRAAPDPTSTSTR